MSTNPVITIHEGNFEAEVTQSPVPVLLDFNTTWCPPCRLLAPILHKLAEENVGRIKVGTVDGDEQAEMAARFRIKGFPTVVALVGGKEVARHIGLTSKERLLQLVAAHVGARPVAA